MCGTHYVKARRAGEFGGDGCAVVGCTEIAVQRRMCMRHYQQSTEGRHVGLDKDVAPSVIIRDGDIAHVELKDRFGRLQGWAVIDADAMALADGRRWRLDAHGYAVSSLGKRTDRLHAFLNATPAGFETDHRDGDKLNLRRRNLRTVTRGQNQQNVPSKNGKYRGTTFARDSGKWIAQAQLDGRRYYLGLFATRDRAAVVARAWRAKNMPFAERGEIIG